MNIIFKKEYIDKDSFDNLLIIEVGQEAFLIDEVTGRIELSGSGFAHTIQIEGVTPGYYVKVED